MPETVGPIEALNALRNHTIGAVRTLIPAVVVTYNPIDNTAICVFARRSQTADGKIFDPAPSPPLPVHWMRGGGWVLRWELQPGDLVDLQVHDRSVGEVLQKGGQVDPENQRRFSLGDAHVIPGLASDKSPHAAGTGDLYLGREDGTATIKIGKTGTVEVDGVSLKLGATAVQAMTMATALQTFLAAAATTAGGAAAGGDGGLAAFTSFASTMAGLVAAAGTTKTKAE